MDRFQYDASRSNIFVKPSALRLWLDIANERGYTHFRLVMHGSDDAGYAGIKADPFGFNMYSVPTDQIPAACASFRFSR